MTDPKIRVSADVSAVQSELQKVQASAAKINQTLSSGQVGIDAKEAKSDLAALESSASKLVKLLDQAKSSGSDLSGVDFASVSESLEEAAKAASTLDQVLSAVGQSSGLSQSVTNSKSIADHIERAVKAQELLGKTGINATRQQAEEAKRQYDKWRKSGARGTSRIKNVEFDDWLAGGWRNYSMDEGEAKRHRDKVLESIGITPGRGESTPQAKRAERTAQMGAAAGALGGMAGSMLGGGGGGLYGAVGSAGGTALGAGAGMAFGGPVGAVIGAFASQLFGGIGRGIDSQIDKITGEGSDLTDLRKMLGSTTVDFDYLRESVRHFSEGLGLSYNEAAKLAKQFEHTAGTVPGKDLGKEVGSAVAFGRGYGMSPEASAQFFANMRHFGISGGEQDNRKLAVNIAEAVSRGGTTAKMDEVLAAIQGFVQNSSRASMTQANAEAYASFMSSMTGLSMPGMKGDVANAMGAMGAADAALRQGGAFGEASKNFSLAAYQRVLPGFSVLDQDFINDQGAFGTIGRAFGRDSAAYKFAESRGDRDKMRQYDEWAAQGGDKSILSLQMQSLDKTFGANTDEFRKSIMSHLGVSAGQASALYQAYQNDRGLGGLQETLKGANVDMSKLNTKQIASLAEVASGDDKSVRNQAFRLLGLKGSDKLSEAESGNLNKAISSNDPDALRKMVIGLTALHDTSKDQGETLRKQQADMSNSLQKLATELIPLTMAIRDGIIEIVRRFSPDSQFVKDQDAAKAKQKAVEGQAAAYDRALDDVKKRIDGFKGSPEDLQKLRDQYNTLVGSRNALDGVPTSSHTMIQPNGEYASPPANTQASARAARRGMKLSDKELAYLAETDRLIGAAPGTSAAQIQVESGNDPDAVSPRGAQGLAQLMPDTKANLEKRLGRKIESRDDQLLAHRMLMQENVQQFGGVNDALRAYNGGWKRQNWLNPETEKYVPTIEATRQRMSQDGVDRKAPAGQTPGLQTASNGRQDVNVNGRFTLYDQNGNQIDQAVVDTRVGPPQPAGTGGRP